MSDLTKIEKIKLERYLEMGAGYVLDFSNKQFEDFVLESLEIDIYEDKYAINGESKANRLRAFWNIESNHVVADLLNKLYEYRKEIDFKGGFHSSEEKNQKLEKCCNDIISRLRGKIKNAQEIEKPSKKEFLDKLKFKVAFSFAGENRSYVKTVKDFLQKELEEGDIFYDEDFTSQLAIPNMDILLQNVYHNNSDLVVIFLCSNYEEKEWCGLEWRAIRDLIKQRQDQSIMLLKFDAANISGTFSIDGHIALSNFSPAQTAKFILERIGLK